MSSLRFCVTALLVCASSVYLVGGRSLPKNHVALFILGDSMFDAGNNNYIETTFRANYCPYGETFFKYATGRFSDGRLIPDFIAEYANLPLIPPYLQPDNHQFTYGVNFASAGAGALAETGQGMAIDLRTQSSHFKNVEKLLRQKLGDAEAKILLSQAVYLITIGANDYLNYNAKSISESKEEYVGMVIGNLTAAIKEIYEKGGRKFGILALGDLGAFFPPMNVATILSQLHNAELSKVLKELNIQLEGFRYAKQDINLTAAEILSNPEIHGFKEVATACCGSGFNRRNFDCGGKRGNCTAYEVCSDPSEYLFFDAYHLTEKANKLIAELLWSGTPNITGPYNLKALFEA
ncbi:GDSL esterase/lipase 1-like [Durio zibethinus]|uniref:GDSL esterase/lipase 1-like n=1 Tax=Durio zibethinus TaxID=66656 RepID=A0A6P5WHT7_DURZI|nr:GDSL esterase/lipase 1-like [Durio zibethinus]